MGAMRWHFALHFLPQLLLHHQQAKTEGETVMHRERDEQNGAVRKGRTWTGNEWWKLARPCPSTAAAAFSLARLSLKLCPRFPSPVSLQRPRWATLHWQAHPRYAGVALLFLMRYPLQDFKRSPTLAPSATLAQRGGRQEGRMGGIRGEIKTDEAWNGKSEARKRRQTFSNLGGEVHVRSSQAYFRLQSNVQRHFCPHEGWKNPTLYSETTIFGR